MHVAHAQPNMAAGNLDFFEKTACRLGFRSSNDRIHTSTALSPSQLDRSYRYVPLPITMPLEIPISLRAIYAAAVDANFVFVHAINRTEEPLVIPKKTRVGFVNCDRIRHHRRPPSDHLRGIGISINRDITSGSPSLFSHYIHLTPLLSVALPFLSNLTFNSRVSMLSIVFSIVPIPFYHVLRLLWARD
jgi:hypothetical protein